MKTAFNNNILTVYLEGRIDISNAADTEKELFAELDTHPDCTPVLDAAKLEFISSAGLRILMKLRKRIKTDLRILNTSPEVYDIFEVTGFTELFKIEKRFRELSVDGCEVLGTGFFGTVYRVNDETIVKVYHSPDSRYLIFRHCM